MGLKNYNFNKRPFQIVLRVNYLTTLFLFITSVTFPQQISIGFLVSDNTPKSKTVYVGIDPTATDGIDSHLGEDLLPPLPPAGSFDARLNINSTEASLKDYRYGTIPYTGVKVHEIQYQPSTGTVIHLNWNLPTGVSGNLKDKLGGIVINYNFGPGAGNYTINNADVLNKLDLTLTYSNVLPVELVSFSVSVVDNAVKLYWKTASEIENYGFFIERNSNNLEWIELGFIKGQGTSFTPREYEFYDYNPPFGKLKYRLKQVDNDGTVKYQSIIAETEYGNKTIPSEFVLFQNYPNPFNPITQISYQLPNASNLELVVLNIFGEVVTIIEKSYNEAGYYTKEFDGTGLSSGIYLCKISTDFNTGRIKMMLLK